MAVPLTYALSGDLRSGAGRAGWPVAVGVVLPKYALSGVARSGATRSNYHSANLFISLAGQQVAIARTDTATGVLWSSVSITDILNATPNTARLTTKGIVPSVGDDVVITLGSINNLAREFAGTVLQVNQADALDPNVSDDHTQLYGLSAIDYTWGLNKRKVRTQFTSTTVGAVAASLLPSGYTLKIDADISAVSIDVTSCFDQLVTRAGGDWLCDYHKVVHIFFEDTYETPPVILNAVHRTLRGFRINYDLSQVVTRVYSEGGGSAALSNINAGETILPVTDASWYQTNGGVVVCGPQRITYAAAVLGGTGGLVGPGASPSGVIVLALASGAGVESGAHSYGTTFVTAAGESIVSPLSAITVGSVTAPSTSPTAGTPTVGTGPNPGTHLYATTFVNASGETTAGLSVSAVTSLTVPPSAAPTASTPTAGSGVTDGVHDYAVTFVTPIGETTPSPISGQVTAGSVAIAVPSAAGPRFYNFLTGTTHLPGTYDWVTTFVNPAGETTPGPPRTAVPTGSLIGDMFLDSIETSADASVTARKIYRRYNGSSFLLVGTISDNTTTTFTDTTANGSEGAPAPSSNTATNPFNVVPLSAIQTGSAEVTSRKLYRRSAGAGLKLLATIGDNTTTTYTDTTANASLGAAVPSVSTAYLQRIPLTAIPLGGSTVTSRKLYRTVAGGSQLKLLATISDNTTTTFTDTVTDASLGANVPVSNTATANQVALSAIPIGAATVTSRKLYRTVTGGSQLKLLATIADNTTVTYTDSIADASLGANVPTSDTSGLTQPAGLPVPIGSTTIPVANAGAFSTSGGWAVIGNGEQVIRYTGITGNTISGIPASGLGAIVATIGYNSSITGAPQLTGIAASGAGSILFAILKGDNVNLFTQSDDAAAQVALAALIGGDGIQEDYLQDGRLSYTEALARGAAQLALKKDVEVGISYTVRDLNAPSGRMQDVNIGAPVSASGSFMLQQVTISNFLPTVMPLRTCQASTVRFTFAELLRMISTKGPQQ